VPNAEQRPLNISEHLGMSKNINDSFGLYETKQETYKINNRLNKFKQIENE
jgi:hypothetical protein